MAVYTLATFEVRPESREHAERAMHDFASFVRTQLADSVNTTYRDAAAPGRYVSMIRADDEAADARHMKAFSDALSGVVVGKIDFMRCALVTSSDLAPRPASGRRIQKRR